MTEIGCAETPMEDHVRRAIELMEAGARMRLDAIPGDTSLSSSLFSKDVTAELAKLLRESQARERKAKAEGMVEGAKRIFELLSEAEFQDGLELQDACLKVEARASEIEKGNP